MWMTPAPPSTALVAASIWSGVGDVNTSPGHAASSMPMPTNPPCIGSCPEPPPDTSATLPLTGASLRTMVYGSYVTLIRSEWAASMPSSASRTTFAGSLMSFFIASPSGRGALAISVLSISLLEPERRLRDQRAGDTADDRPDDGDPGVT